MVYGGDDTKERIRDSLSLVSIVEGYVKLRRSGKNFSACCPFHKEKTPSFYVFPETNTFKCFGCGKGGDLFTFVQEVENLDFKEALSMLARQAGITLEQTSASSRPSQSGVLRPVLTMASEFFAQALVSTGGEKALQYLRGRGLEKAVRPFGLGYAPASWSSLLDHAQKLDIDRQLLVRAGLAREGNKGLYDYFRDRLIIPINDALGRVVGFGARTIDGSEPKYLNSPDSPLFSKGRLLYGLDKARRARPETVIVVEGYTDQMAAAMAGVEGVVAGLGTALTQDHGQLLERYFRDGRVVLLYDGDGAGLRAAERAVVELASISVDLRVALLHGGQDPADLVGEKGGAALVQLAREAASGFKVKLDLVCQRYDLASTMGKAKAVQDISEYLVRVDNPVRLEAEVRQAAGQLGVSPSALSRALNRPRRQVRRELDQPGSAEVNSGPVAPPTPGRKAQERILEILLFEPSLLGEVDPLFITDQECRGVFEQISKLVERMDRKKTFPWDSLLDSLRNDQAWMNKVVGWRHRPTPVKDRGLWLRQSLFELRQLSLESEITDLNRKIDKARTENKNETVLDLRRRRQRLINTTKVNRLADLQEMEE